jgi:hypothetical protein
MMILGFAMVGAGLRRSRRSGGGRSISSSASA